MTQLVDNERIKFTAAALDRASTGCFVIGIFGPISAFYQGQLNPAWPQFIGLVTWFLVGAILHLRGHGLIGNLAE